MGVMLAALEPWAIAAGHRLVGSKTWLRSAAERTMEGLHRCVGSYIWALDPLQCIAYFRHSGYEPL
jgi:hypothetical protein